jgi:ankyrin repeat protein
MFSTSTKRDMAALYTLGKKHAQADDLALGLLAAIACRDIPSIDRLFAWGADPLRTGLSTTPLSAACASCELGLARRVLDACPAGSLERDGEASPLIAAVSHPDETTSLALVALLLDRCDPRKASKTTKFKQATPLMVAALLGRARAIELLGPASAPWEPSNDLLKLSPLALATHNGHHDAVKALLALGHEREQCFALGTASPLHCAAMRGDAELVALLAPFSDPNAQDEHGRNPALVAACSYNRAALAKLLPLTNPDQVDHEGISLRTLNDPASRAGFVLWWRASRGSKDTMDFLRGWFASHQTRAELDQAAKPGEKRRTARARI